MQPYKELFEGLCDLEQRVKRLERTRDVKFKVEPHGRLPSRARESDAGFDFYAAEDVDIIGYGTGIISLGVSWEPDGDDLYLQLKSRSGLAFKNGIEVTNAGVIDASYRGVIKVKLINQNGGVFSVREGDKICQGIIYQLPIVSVVGASSLAESDRGDKGFGSSGV